MDRAPPDNEKNCYWGREDGRSGEEKGAPRLRANAKYNTSANVPKNNTSANECSVKLPLPPKKIPGNVMSTHDSYKNIETITQNCEKCGNDKAYVSSFQTRSADEAATILYTCTKCKATTSEN